MSRFDYVAYDERAQTEQAQVKELMQRAEGAFVTLRKTLETLDELRTMYDGRAAEKIQGRMQLLCHQLPNDDDFMTGLELAYMWFGKAIRDDQIARNGSAPLQEERGNE